MEFAGRGCQVYACDIDRADLGVLSEQVRAADIRDIFPTLYDGTTLPFPDEWFDTALSFQVLEHVADEHRALSEISRVLRPGGDFVLTVPNKWWVFEMHGARLPLLPWNRVPFFSWLPKPIHSRFARARIYTVRDTVGLLRTHGFEIIETGYMTAPMDMVRWAPLQRVLRKAVFRDDRTGVPFIATEILVHCRKPQ